jgi:uncharacterized protein HemX
MRKANKNKSKPKNKKAATQNVAADDHVDQTKRKTLSTLRNSAIGLVLAGGAGSYVYGAYQADLKERDLTQVGRGKPTIVQIHDPNCPMCTALQKATRSALQNFEEDELKYLVANIKTAKGREFANQHNVPHVTLLLFDKRGKLQNVLQGVRKKEELKTVFSSLIGK